MTIPRVWANGPASMPLSADGRPMLSTADLASLDANLQRAVDKQVGGSSLEGVVTLGGNGSISLDAPAALVDVQGAITTANGGRLECGDGDFFEFSAPRTRTVFTSFLEAFLNFTGGSVPVGPPDESIVGVFPAGVSPKWEWYADPPSANLQVGKVSDEVDQSNTACFLPVTRTHDDGSTLVLSAYFVVSSTRTVLPTRYPGINLLRVDPFLGTVASVSGWTYFPPAANVAAYKNGGVANRVFLTSSEVLDIERYVYVLAVLDEDYGGIDLGDTFGNLYSGMSEVVVLADMEFQ